MALALVVACRPQVTLPSPSDSTQPEGQVLEQNVPPTPPLATVVIPPDAQMSPHEVQPHKQRDCPELDSTLAQIVQSPNPLDLAQQLRLTTKDNKIQVLLILDRKDIDFLQDFQVEVGTQFGTRVQAFVPVSQLCNLANTDAVLAVRVPNRAILP